MDTSKDHSGHPSAAFPSLVASAPHCYIIAYKEDTTALEGVLCSEGFSVETLRPAYTDLELTYSRTIRCLLNHAGAWERASRREGLTVIVEADFVPCLGFGKMPLPFDPQTQPKNSWAFLYSGGPRIFERLADGSTTGHSSCPVAVVVSPAIGRSLVEYTREELARHGDLTQYSLWDTQFQWHIMGKGGRCFMARRQFGEHGGMPNREHRKAPTGILVNLPLIRWLGIGVNHHADTLVGPLAFLPAYAKGSRLRFLRKRFEAKALGLIRLFAGRTIARMGPGSWVVGVRLWFYGLVRLLNRY